jgi:hypothetical protein
VPIGADIVRKAFSALAYLLPSRLMTAYARSQAPRNLMSWAAIGLKSEMMTGH